MVRNHLEALNPMAGSIVPYSTKSGKMYRARWRDASGIEQSKSFNKRSEASAHLRDLDTKVKGGVAKNLRWLVEEFLNAKLALVEAGQLERSSYALYGYHLNKHLLSDVEIAKTRLSDLDAPIVRRYLRRLIGKVSRFYAGKIKTSLSVCLQWGVGEGYLSINPARGLRLEGNERAAVEVDAEFDDVDVKNLGIPTPEQAAALIAAADDLDKTGRAGAQLRVLFHCGLRPSEMLGFPVKMFRVDTSGRAQLKIVQRSDHTHGAIGPLKNAGSRRKVTMGKAPATHLRKYLLAIGKPTEGLMFPTRSGGAQRYSNFRTHVWNEVCARAGLAVREEGGNIKPMFTPHHGRHFAISALIGSGADPKRVQEFAGHATLKMTMDTYGHLFPDTQKDEDMADAIEASLRSAKN